MNDEVIDKNLKLLLNSNSNSGITSELRDCNNKELDRYEIYELVDILKENGFIKFNDGGNSVFTILKNNISNFLNEYGSWNNYLISKIELKNRKELTEKLEIENKIAENDKLKHEKDLRQLQIDLTNSNLKSNNISNSSVKFGYVIGLLTLLSLTIQIGLNQYNESKRKEIKKMETRLQSKTNKLNLSLQKVDSLKTLLSNQNHTKNINTE